MGWFRELLDEMKARRAGRRHLSNDIARSARDITGPIGWAHSPSWRKLESDGTAYLKSFDPRVPPSLHISARDRSRHNLPIPLVERCVEDWGKDRADPTEEPEIEDHG